MVRLALVGAIVSAALAAAVAPASAVVLKTNWIEKTQRGDGSYTIYIRKIEITRTTWKAWVGLANKTGESMQIDYGLVKQGPRTVLQHGPGIWFNGPLKPGSVLSGPRHADATSVRPPLPHLLRAGQSWFAAIQGSALRLPKDRLLRIGFGWLQHGYAYPTEISTTHQFRVPRRLS
jgi:hypothetical protein